MAGGSIPANLAPIFQAAGRANNIPAPVLAGIASVESNLGQNTGPSSAGAIGVMQFLPSTAQSIGVNPNDPRSAIFGAAKLLNSYGFQQNPTRAIGAYNGGPGNPQYGYARQVLSEAARLHGQLAGAPGAPPQSQGSSGGSLSFTVPQTVQSFDRAGFQAAQAKFIAGNAVKEAGSSANPFNVAPGAGRGFASSLNAPNPLFAKGLLTTSAPNAGDFVSTQTVPQTINVAHQELQHIAGMPLAHPNVGGGVIARMFPQGARIPQVGRHDMGRDLENGQPGAPVLALGNGHVVSVNSDPSGFGNAYPVVHFDSGPWAGLDVYFGHVQALLHPGQAFRAGQPIAQLQNGTGPFVGNAAGMPGHIEIGMASQLGHAGQGPLPPGL